MFGFFKRRKAEAPKQKLGRGEPVIAALLLAGDSFPADDFLQQVAATRIAGRKATEVERGDGKIVSFRLGDELVALALMPAPYPASDLDGPLATSLLWPREPSIDTVKTHRSHLLVTMIGGDADPIRRRLILTAITALAAKQRGVMAVYWPDATHIVYPPLFVEMAGEINSPEAPPLHLWVDMRVFRNDDGTTALFTTGLVPLGHMEIEIPSIDMPPGELRDWLINIIFYLLENGPVLQHGQTIGMTAEQKIRISHAPSEFGHEGKVIRLEP